MEEKTISRKRLTATIVTAFIMALLMAFSTPLTTFAAAQEKYISEMVIVAGKDANEAKGKLESDYLLLETPIYEGDTENTYIAYKTTNDRNDAIVDIKAMNMNGAYSYEEYENYLRTLKDTTTKLVNGLKAGIEEARANYNAEKEGAMYAYSVMQYLYDDDSGKTLAELFFDGAMPSGDQLVTIMMQGNIDIVENIERLLMIACSDTADNSFLDVLNGQTEPRTVTAADTAAFSEQINDLLSTLEGLQNPIEFYEKFKKDNNYSDAIEAEAKKQQAEIDKYYATFRGRISKEQATQTIRSRHMNTDAGRALYNYEAAYNALAVDQKQHYELGKAYSETLKACSYPSQTYKTLYELLTAHELTMKDDGTIEGKSEYKAEDFVPLIYALTPGQRGLLKVGIDELLMSVTTDKSVFAAAFDELRGYNYDGDLDKAVKNGEYLGDSEDNQLSVYAGVDRSLFSADGIAMTSDAIAKMKNEGTDEFGRKSVTESQNEIFKYIGIASAGTVVGLTLTTFTLALIKYLPTAGLISKLGGTALGTGVTSGVLGFKSALVGVLNSIFGTVSVIIGAVAIIAGIVAGIFLLVNTLKEDNPDAVYLDVPRALCSVETVDSGELDGDGEHIIKAGYVFYYGVKNPEVPVTGADDKNNPNRYGVADVYNWKLSGKTREWLALYTTKDLRMGEPIKAGSLTVSGNSIEVGCNTVEYFHSGNQTCDLMCYHTLTHSTLDSMGANQVYKYLHYQVYTAGTSGAASVFANSAVWAIGGIGLVIGAAGGILVKYLTDRNAKRKKSEA